MHWRAIAFVNEVPAILTCLDCLNVLLFLQNSARVSRDLLGPSAKLQVNSPLRISRWTPSLLVWTENNRIAVFVSWIAGLLLKLNSLYVIWINYFGSEYIFPQNCQVGHTSHQIFLQLGIFCEHDIHRSIIYLKGVKTTFNRSTWE